KANPQDLQPVSGKVRKSMLWEERSRRLKGSTYKGQSNTNRDLKGRSAQTFVSADEKLVYVRTQANTLDLRGKRVDEGLGILEEFVDTCAVNRVTPFMIIHGHGTGAMKSAVREYLTSMRYPGQFRPGEIHEGGDGVTVVDLHG